MAILAAAIALIAVSLPGCTSQNYNQPPGREPVANRTPHTEPREATIPPEVTAWPYEEPAEVPEGYESVMRLKEVSFPSGTTALDGEALGALRQAVTEITANPDWYVLVVGFTDAISEQTDAVRLSKLRADEVKAYLSRSGADASRISTMGLGSRYATGGEFEPGQIARDRNAEVWAFTN